MDTKKWERVWQRVRSTEPSVLVTKENREEQRLAEFIADEDRDRAFYGALAPRCANPAGQTLTRLRDEEAGHWKALQREYFLLTGNSAPPSGAVPGREPGILSALRQAIGNEKRGAEAYRRAAAETASPRLRELYRRFAADEARHSEILLRLLDKAMK